MDNIVTEPFIYMVILHFGCGIFPRNLKTTPTYKISDFSNVCSYSVTVPLTFSNFLEYGFVERLDNSLDTFDKIPTNGTALLKKI